MKITHFLIILPFMCTCYLFSYGSIEQEQQLLDNSQENNGAIPYFIPEPRYNPILTKYSPSYPSNRSFIRQFTPYAAANEGANPQPMNPSLDSDNSIPYAAADERANPQEPVQSPVESPVESNNFIPHLAAQETPHLQPIDNSLEPHHSTPYSIADERPTPQLMERSSDESHFNPYVAGEENPNRQPMDQFPEHQSYALDSFADEKPQPQIMTSPMDSPPEAPRFVSYSIFHEKPHPQLIAQHLEYSNPNPHPNPPVFANEALYYSKSIDENKMPANEESDQNCCIQDDCCSDCTDTFPYPMYAYLSHVEGKSVAFQLGYTTFGVYGTIPMFQRNRFQPFLDVRAHIFNNGQNAMNLGGGFRYLSPSLGHVFGINAYYDSREKYHRYFHQAGVGFEMLGPCFDFRMNGYIPVGKRIKGHKEFFEWSDCCWHGTCQEAREAQAGIDAEIGKCFKMCTPCGYLHWYGAIGSYYYFEGKCPCSTPHIWGGQGRLSAQLLDCLSFEIGASYDREYNGNVYGRLALVLPFNICCCSSEKTCYLERSSCQHHGLRCIATQPVHRQEMIVLGKKHCIWDVNW